MSKIALAFLASAAILLGGCAARLNRSVGTVAGSASDSAAEECPGGCCRLPPPSDG
jgi:hypothetical protein